MIEIRCMYDIGNRDIHVDWYFVVSVTCAKSFFVINTILISLFHGIKIIYQNASDASRLSRSHDHMASLSTCAQNKMKNEKWKFCSITVGNWLDKKMKNLNVA